MGKDTAKIKYDKLTIKDPDKAGKKTSNFENLKYYKVKVPEDIESLRYSSNFLFTSK